MKSWLDSEEVGDGLQKGWTTRIQSELDHSCEMSSNMSNHRKQRLKMVLAFWFFIADEVELQSGSNRH